MKSFISEVVAHLLSTDTDLEKTTFIFPSKRAGRFLQQHLKQVLEKTIFSPKIYSIEEFVEEVSGLASVENTDAIFRLYSIYQILTPKAEQEDFETFYNWSQTLIYDFNEIDRYLIEADSFFSYLSDIQDLKHWSQAEEKTELVKNYLQFWHRLPGYYDLFTKTLIADKSGHQGLQYRIASEKIAAYLKTNTHQLVFVGFNALNSAEQKIIQTVLNAQKGSIFWDTDEVFFNDKFHGASRFLRDYKAKWEIYTSGKNSFNWIASNYKNEKNIEIIGVPKNIGQAKYVGNLLSKIPSEELKNTALILGDEGLTMPILNSLPDSVTALNITMGLPLDQTPLASLFDLLIRIHSTNPVKFYYKDVVEIVNHPAMVPVIGATAENILFNINKNNRTFLSKQEILALSDPKNHPVLSTCFDDYKNKPLPFLYQLERLTEQLRRENAALTNESLFHFHKLFNSLITLLEKENPVKSIKTFYQIYQNSIQHEVLDFNGSQFSGLQMMGMLETRVLDFETVIITSVNEGVLPAGKSTNSFIPYDLKKEKGLPTYTEKDAVYSYHFYRLLQRAKKVFLLYNSVPGDLNAGEKSRFITQLKIEQQPLHHLREYMVSPSVPVLKNELKTIEKTPEILQKLKELAAYGFSPSALLSYIRNPLDFYNRYILGVKETDEVEETVAANTLGTVIHDALENLYKSETGRPYLLTEDLLQKMLSEHKTEIKQQFEEHYPSEALTTGKNLLVFEVAKRYVFNFLQTELKSVQENEIEIVSLEKQLKTKVRFHELDFPVFLRGKADRIDRFNGENRIIDYKTGKVASGEVKLLNWEEITDDYKYSKAFQVLCYAYMEAAENPASEHYAGIISFRNLGAGFMGFVKKEKTSDRTRNQSITSETLSNFEEELKKLILELFDPKVPFVEKEIEPRTWK